MLSIVSKRFLHQTTTVSLTSLDALRCMPFDSYIKPQPSKMPLMLKIVVCLLIPTSNHNPVLWYWFQRVLYAFWFLHQTTTGYHRYWELKGCMPFDSYIKPQHQLNCQTANGVVCLLIPTSNHNLYLWAVFVGSVVCLLIPTSNHNAWAQKNKRIKLYAFWFLHQTTTWCLFVFSS